MRTPKHAGFALLPLQNVDWPRQTEIIEILNANKTRVFSIYGGNDPLIEVEINRELVAAMRDNKEFVC